jgi:hypothetical protein
VIRGHIAPAIISSATAAGRHPNRMMRAPITANGQPHMVVVPAGRFD